MDNAKNFAKVTVSTGYNSAAVSVVLATGHGAKLPTVPFNATWWNSTDYGDSSDDPDVEIVRVTAISTDTLTVTRAQESTAASNKNIAGKTYKMIAGLTAKSINTDLPNLNLNAPQGFLINGKISVTVASNNITVAIKTLAGNNPSATDPVSCRIGDTVRSITAALSVTKNAGTNWFNSGSAAAATGIATNEVDYFVYLGYNTTDGVVIGFARIPYANQYDDFSATTTSERYCAISTITNAASTDYYEVIGRFAATLSGTASFNWSVPTYTSKNLINRPIFNTRWLTYTPTLTWDGTPPTTIVASVYKYMIDKTELALDFNTAYTNAGTTNTLFTTTTPFAERQTFSTQGLYGQIINGGGSGYATSNSTSTQLRGSSARLKSASNSANEVTLGGRYAII